MLFIEPHRVPPGIRRSTRYQVPVVRVCTRLFAFVVGFVLHLGSLRNFFFANYTRTSADHNVAPPTNSTENLISSAQVARGIIKSIVALNHGPLLSAPFTFRWSLPCASVAGGVSRPRSGALVYSTCTSGRSTKQSQRKEQ